MTVQLIVLKFINVTIFTIIVLHYIKYHTILIVWLWSIYKRSTHLQCILHTFGDPCQKSAVSNKIPVLFQLYLSSIYSVHSPYENYYIVLGLLQSHEYHLRRIPKQ